MCVCVCLSVPKNLANPWTDMVLLYSVALHRSWVFKAIWEEGNITFPREIAKSLKEYRALLSGYFFGKPLVLKYIAKKTFCIHLEASRGVNDNKFITYYV